MRKLAYLSLLLSVSTQAWAVDAKALIRSAIEHERDRSSYSVFQMTIHRPDWQRTMVLEAWTSGLKKSLVRIQEPKKDAGAGNLSLDNRMWSYSPKINRVIKLPSSMMNQSWMGSDFTNNDLAKSDDMIDNYQHRVIKETTQDRHKVFTIESIPHDDAPVVWGKEISRIRDDYLLLEHEFYDQDGRLVKTLVTKEIKSISGKLVATHMRMEKMEQADEWTEVRLLEAKFDISIPESTFTLSNLRNPRR